MKGGGFRNSILARLFLSAFAGYMPEPGKWSSGSKAHPKRASSVAAAKRAARKRNNIRKNPRGAA